MPRRQTTKPIVTLEVWRSYWTTLEPPVPELDELFLRCGVQGVRMDDSPAARACSLWVGGILAAGLGVLAWAAIRESLLLALSAGFFVMNAILVTAVYKFVPGPRRIVATLATFVMVDMQVAIVWNAAESFEVERDMNESAKANNFELDAMKKTKLDPPVYAEHQRKFWLHHAQYLAHERSLKDLLSANDALLTGLLVGFVAMTIFSQAAPGKRNFD